LGRPGLGEQRHVHAALESEILDLDTGYRSVGFLTDEDEIVHPDDVSLDQVDQVR
jgi:hypothetical protein